MAFEFCTPRLKQPIGDLSRSLPVSLQNEIPLYLRPRFVHEIVFDYLKSTPHGSIHEFLRTFEGLLKAELFENGPELQREYFDVGKKYSELKEIKEWSENESNTSHATPDHLPGLTAEEKKLVLSKGQMRTIERGVRIIREGTVGTKIFFLLKGAVDLFRKNTQGQKEHVCQLPAGHVLGEYGAFLDIPRTADIITTTACELFVVDAEDLKGLSLSSGNVFETLKERVFLFKNLRSETGLEPLPFPAIRKFFDDGEIVSYTADKIVFDQGDWGQKVHFILDGEVHILKDGQIRRTLKRGDFFGEIALLKKTQRSAQARTAVPCNLLEVDHLCFIQTLSQNISVAIRVEKVIGQRIKRF